MPRVIRFGLRAVAFGFTFVVLCGAIGAGVGILTYHRLTQAAATLSLNPIPQPTASSILDRNGAVLATIPAGIHREPVELTQVSDVARNAVLVAEDHDFLTRSLPISVSGISRAYLYNLTHAGRDQGGSTITQQTVRLLLGRPHAASKQQKLEELEYAIRLNSDPAWPRAAIFREYINDIDLGRQARGIQAAAQAYYGIDASGLNALQSATLAALIREPEILNSRDQAAGKRRLVSRRQLILDALQQRSWITPAQYHEAMVQQAALPDQLGFLPAATSQPRTDSRFPFATQLVLQALAGLPDGNKQLEGGGLVIKTTLDSALMQEVERQVTLHRPSSGPLGAAVVLNGSTGELLAFYGGNFASSQFNLATQSVRALGSTMKPVALAAAVAAGVSPQSNFPAPASITPPGARQPITNDDGQDYGTLTLKDALSRSVNTEYTELANGLSGSPIHPLDVATLGRQLGLTTGLAGSTYDPASSTAAAALKPVPSIALGPDGVTLVASAAAYGTLGNHGVYNQPHVITSITWNQYPIAIPAWTSGVQVLPAPVADTVAQALRGPVEDPVGTARFAAFGRPVAAKTGTSSNFADVRLIGFTPDALTTSVWYGFNSNAPVTSPGQPEFGGGAPAAAFRGIMLAATQNRPVAQFDEVRDNGTVLGTPTAPPSPDASASTPSALDPQPGTQSTPLATQPPDTIPPSDDPQFQLPSPPPESSG